MALSKPSKIIICAFFVPVLVWVAASLYFTLAGRDISGDFTSDYLPAPQNLKPEENAYVAIREYAENLPSNSTSFHVNYKLCRAYLDGTTNRLDLADEALAYVTAESNTIAVAKRILVSKGIEVPFEELFDANANWYIGRLVRIANVYRVKATYEAAQGDIAAGRKSLMDVYRIGRFFQTHDSLVLGISRIFGNYISCLALDSAAKPLFAPDGDEAWRKKLRELILASLDDDAEYAKIETRRALSGYIHATVNDYTTNRLSRAKSIYGVHNLWEIAMSGKRLNDNRMDRINGMESRFLAALSTACLGYDRYSFQPNRTLALKRMELEEVCRKIDESTFDAGYAAKTNCFTISRYARNWLGLRLFPTSTCRSSYRQLFGNRFGALARTAKLACRSYKVKYGKYPETLSALVPEFLDGVLQDPYDGEALRYNAKDGFIWTRGETLSFDGNVTILENGKPYFRNSSDRRCVIFLDKH